MVGDDNDVNDSEETHEERASMAAPMWVYEREPTRRTFGRRSIVAGVAALAAVAALVVPHLLASPDRLPTLGASARSPGGSRPASPGGSHSLKTSPHAAASGSASAKASPTTPPPVAASPQPSGVGSSAGGAANLRVGRVRYVRQGRRLSAVVVLTDPNTGLWLPPSDLAFRALNRQGNVIATYQTTVTLEPGGSKIVVAPLLYLGTNASDFRSIDIVLDRARWQPASTFVPKRVRVWGEHVGTGDGGKTVVRGNIANPRDRDVSVQIACALWAGRRLAGVGIATVPTLPSGILARFLVRPEFVDRKPDTADCTVDLIV
jgi:hypothetical protein